MTMHAMPGNAMEMERMKDGAMAGPAHLLQVRAVSRVGVAEFMREGLCEAESKLGSSGR